MVTDQLGALDCGPLKWHPAVWAAVLLETCLDCWAIYTTVIGSWLVMGLPSALDEAAGKNHIRVQVMDIIEVV